MFSATPKRRQSGAINDESGGDSLYSQDDADAIFARHRLFKSKYTHFHVVVFVITFFSYAMLHANRKSFSNVKVLISEEWTPSYSNATVKAKSPDSLWNKHHMFSNADGDDCKTFLGSLDTIFMCAYAVGLFISGPIGDRFNLRFVLCGGMLLSSITIFLFACVPEWAGFYAIYWYVPLWIANGLFQSTAWPAVVSIMGNWFGKSHRGLIFGVWSANASVGNILGSVICAAFVNLGYDIAMLIPAVMLFCSAIIIFFGLVISPTEIGLPAPKQDSNPEEITAVLPNTASFGAIAPPVLADISGEGSSLVSRSNSELQSPVSSPAPKKNPKTNKPVGFLEAVLLPGVIIYSVAYACLKLVNYSFFFWLPYYLNRQFHWSQADADNLSVWYDFGGIFGGIIGGYVSDKLKRAPVMAVMLILSLPCLFIYQNLPNNMLMNAIGLGILGFFIGGVANIISAAVCADLGRQPKLRGNTAALATVTGILDGTGSAGAAVGQLLIPILEQNLGWDAVFYMFIACTFLTAVCISPIVYREMRESNLVHRLRHCCCCCKPDSDDHRGLLVHEDGADDSE